MIMAETELGREAVDAYARYLGVQPAEFVMTSAVDPGQLSIADVWARLGDLGRFGLIAAAVSLPLKRRNSDGSFDASPGS